MIIFEGKYLNHLWTQHLADLKQMSTNVSKILDIKGILNLPIGLSVVLQDTFKCSTCFTSPMHTNTPYFCEMLQVNCWVPGMCGQMVLDGPR